MKGLLKKDMELLKINGRVFGIAVLVALVYSLTGKMGAQFIMVYLTIMSAFLVLNTVSYDEAEKGMTFLMTLPVLRDTYVKEKYIFAAGL
ncbi:MAG TPA: ABC-2 transporter permease, partial [Candidatus Blautia faecavium]|nr:ABC-2 transporter permease [Candidatus Blautia faecavium]